MTKNFFQSTNSNDKISFITLNFTGSGNNKLDIIGTTLTNNLTETVDDDSESSSSSQSESNLGGGCLIATATYGSELSSQVQLLREIRDNKLLQTQSGTNFINSFNSIYYSFSPIIADLEREYPVFREVVKIALIPMIYSLSILNHVDMNSEFKTIGYGISLMLLNIGMYFLVPANCNSSIS